MFRSRRMLAACVLSAAGALSCLQAASGQVVISQLYGAGGTTGATLRYDYVELFNRGTTAVDLSTWSVQYAAVAGTSWGKVNLTGSIAPGGYYLIRGASGGAIGTDWTLTTPPDCANNLTTDMSGTQGKLALVANQTTLPAQPCFPAGSNGIIDIVGYGGATTLPCFEGNAGMAAPSTTLASYRSGGGCADTNANSVDTVAGGAAPAPRNSSAAANLCGALTGACCISAGSCQILSESACLAIGGASYAGDGSVCAPGSYIKTVGTTAIDDISTQGASVLQGAAAVDNTSTAEALPSDFLFFYHGQRKTNFRVNTDGWMTLSPTTATSAANVAFPNATLLNDVLAPYWEDLQITTTAPMNAGRIYRLIKGAAPTRQYIVQWSSVYTKPVSGVASAPNTFQIILNEGSNVIEYRYGAVAANGTSVNSGGATLASFNAGFDDLSGSLGQDVTSDVGAGNVSITFTPTGVCPTIGSCCKSTACSTNDRTGCVGSGGTYNGDGTTCSPSPCVQPTGSCCVAAACSISTQANCGGSWTLNGSCSPSPCQFACCDGTTGACTVLAVGDSCSGASQAVGSSCSPDPCAAVRGSCCDPSTSICTLATLSGCPGGSVFSGNGSTCTSNPCPAPANDGCGGAIALSLNVPALGNNNSATDDTGAGPTCNTLSGFNHGVWYTFTPTVDQCYGAATCDANGTTTFDSRVYVYTGTCGSLTCTWANTTAPAPACTNPNGANAKFFGTAGVTYYIIVAGDTAATGNFAVTVTDAVAPLGVCCNNTTGTCSLLCIGACPTGSTLNASASVCAPEACPVLRTCCNNTTGECSLMYGGTACASGTTIGSNLVCDPSSCPIARVCCNNTSGLCTPMFGGTACAAGSTLGSGLTCEPTTCDIVRGACCQQQTGACTLVFSADCASLALPGTFLGVGVVCPGGLCFGEHEPNSTTFAAFFNDPLTNPATLSSGDAITGIASGGGLDAGNNGNGSASNPAVDFWLVSTSAQPLGIYRHEMMQIQGSSGQGYGLRGRGQVNGAPAFGNAPLQSGTGASKLTAWYGFGKQEKLIIEPFSGSTTPYVYQLTDTPVTPTVAAGSLAEGAVTIRVVSTGTTPIDSDTWLYDSNFNALTNGADGPGGAEGQIAANDPAGTTSSFTHTLAPGIYYLAVSPTNLCNDQPNDPIEGITSTGTTTALELSYFPDVVLCSQMGQTVEYTAHVELVDASNSTVISPDLAWTGTWNGLVHFVRFTVAPVGVSGACCAANGTCTQTLESGCTGTWTSGGACLPNPCAGACCCGSHCSITTAAACLGNNQRFVGGGSVCTPFSFSVPCCRGDYNKNAVGAPISVQDIFDFLTGYFGGDACSDANDSGAISVQDIFDFLTSYFGGC